MARTLASEAKRENQLTRAGVGVSPWEAIAYDELVAAADAGQPCPLNLDIEMLIGCRSCSVVPTIIAKLERKGLVKVIRCQRYRRVQIVASGAWTAQRADQHQFNPHVPRGASRQPFRTERKVYRAS